MNKFLSLTILIFFPLSLAGQTKTSPEEIFEDAVFFYDTEEYEESAYLFQQLAMEDPDNHNIRFRLGMAYLNIPGKEYMAIPHFKKAVENTTLKYKENDFDEKEAPHHAWFYLGKAYRIDNKLNEALDSYQVFMDIRNFEKKYNLRITENEIASCQRAKIIKDSPIMMSKQNLGQTINSTGHNFHPVLTPDERIMVFMQRLKFYDAIMYTYKEDGEWVSPINITPQVGSDGDMIPTGLSPDGTELLLAKKEAFDNHDIYISKLEGNFWSKAEEISKKINTLRNEDHASFSSDGNMILFASDRRGGYGKLDIYRSERQADGEWSSPENLGPVINTEQDETSAFLMNDDRHLYFSSSGHFNMGGYDIFFSEKDNGNWLDPVNIGYPLSTTGDNKFYQPVRDGYTGYVSLFRENENLNEEDIYRIEFAPLAKIPVNPASTPDQDFRIRITNPETGETIFLSFDKENQKFTIESDKKTNYKVEVIE